MAAVALVLAGCGDRDSASGSKSANLPTPAEVLQAFRNDLAVCDALVNTMKADTGFLQAFKSADIRRTRSRESLLRESPFAGTPPYEHLIANPQYFFLGVGHPENPFAAAWVPGEPVFCGPSLARLKTVEALGESEEAWTVRQYFLDKLLASLSHPSRENAGGSIDFEYLEPFIREAANRYKGPIRPRFLAWLQQAIAAVQAGRAQIEDGAAGLSAETQHGMLDERIAILRAYAQP